jgi:hypothetical protein
MDFYSRFENRAKKSDSKKICLIAYHTSGKGKSVSQTGDIVTTFFWELLIGPF